MEQGLGAALVSQGLCAHWDRSIRGLVQPRLLGWKVQRGRSSLVTFWSTAFRERYSGPKLIGFITTTNLLSVLSFFLSQFPQLATKVRSRESMAGRLAEAESILSECGKER